ncbi:hypothetical protein G7Y89_g6038 [Cudoniella acicularis]|uniref:Uncharacterized protein n=1 Tax=Cudoniella acicularis TaxID=354080 RepID=A0A8H4RM37_9HELO|nr:hypothetical protein G7Y89_g6038 [Cudoniella acicularis]
MAKFNMELDPSPTATCIGLDMYFFNGDGENLKVGGTRWRKIFPVRYRLKYGEKLNPPGLRKAVIRTLVAVVECGISWVQYMAEHILQDWDRIILIEGIHRLLDHEKINMIRGREREPFDTKYIDSAAGRRQAETPLDLSRFLIHNSLPWESKQTLEAYEPVCIVNRKSGPNDICGKALMYAYIPDSGSNVDVICATPTVLLQDEYSKLFRGWTLAKGSPEKEQDDTGAWKWKFNLLGKSRIYGMVSAARSRAG